MWNDKKTYARLLHKRHFSSENGFDIVSIFKLRTPGGRRGRLERGVSLIDTECARDKNGGICGYVKANANTYGGFGEDCVFWIIDAKQLPQNCNIEENDKNCHAELIINPEHNQDAAIFRRNNEELLCVVGDIYSERDVYICIDGKAKPFSARDFSRIINATDKRKKTRKEENKISKFQDIIK